MYFLNDEFIQIDKEYLAEAAEWIIRIRDKENNLLCVMRSKKEPTFSGFEDWK